MKINKINIDNLKNLSNHFVHVNPDSIELSDLEQGCVLKTLYDYRGKDEENHWLYVNVKQMKQIFGSLYPKDNFALVKPIIGSIINASYLEIDMYKDYWPYENDPNVTASSNFMITDVWYSDLDTSYIDSAYKLKEFFDKYNIYNL